MKMRAIWILLVTVAAAMARPSLAQYDWADLDRAVATAHLHDSERTRLIDTVLPHAVRPSEMRPSAPEGPGHWTAMAGITLGPRGQMIDGFVQVHDTLLGWDYVNDPVWLQSAACQALNKRVDPTAIRGGLTGLTSITCTTQPQPTRQYSSSLGASPMDVDYSRNRTLEADAPIGSNPDAWGISIGRSGRAETFVRVDRDGSQQITRVIWEYPH